MSSYFKVKALLGEAVDDVLNSVRNGDFREDQITSVAEHLGASEEDEPNVLYGNHRQRMEGDKNRRYSTEMKDILSDLYNQKVFDQTKEESLFMLIDVFYHPDVNMKPLAKKLETRMPSQKGYTQMLMKKGLDCMQCSQFDVAASLLTRCCNALARTGKKADKELATAYFYLGHAKRLLEQGSADNSPLQDGSVSEDDENLANENFQNQMNQEDMMEMESFAVWTIENKRPTELIQKAETIWGKESLGQEKQKCEQFIETLGTPSKMERLHNWVRSHKKIVLAVIGFAVIAVIAIIVVSQQTTAYDKDPEQAEASHDTSPIYALSITAAALPSTSITFRIDTTSSTSSTSGTSSTPEASYISEASSTSHTLLPRIRLIEIGGSDDTGPSTVVREVFPRKAACSKTQYQLPNLPVPLRGHVAILTNTDKIGILVCGGENIEEQSQTICFNHVLGSSKWNQFPHGLKKPRKGSCVIEEGNKIKVKGGVKMERNPYTSNCTYRHSPIGVIKSSEILDLSDTAEGWQLKKEDGILCSSFICYGPSRIYLPCL